MANYKTLPGSKVHFVLTIEEPDLKAAQKKVVDNARQHLAIKGFRKGHAPDDMVIGSIGPERLMHESMSHSIDSAYSAFITKNQLSVINQPEVDIQDAKEMPMSVNITVEVYPEVKLGDYKKIKVTKTKVEVKDHEAIEALETACSQLSLGNPVPREAKDKDLVEVDFSGKDEKGEELPNTGGKNQKFRLGMGHFLPDLEKAYIGMKAGDEKKAVKVKFPKDYHSPDFAGKTVPFDIKLHQVFEIDVEALTEAQVEQLCGEKISVKELKEKVKDNITQNKARETERKDTETYTDKLAPLVKTDLPESWLDREVHTRMQRLEHNPQFKNDPGAFWKVMGKSEKDYKEEMRAEGAKDLKVFLGLSEIVKQENIELDKDEFAIAKQIAHNNLGQDGQKGYAHDLEVEKAVMNMKIDKFLRSAIMEG